MRRPPTERVARFSIPIIMPLGYAAIEALGGLVEACELADVCREFIKLEAVRLLSTGRQTNDSG